MSAINSRETHNVFKITFRDVMAHCAFNLAV